MPVVVVASDAPGRRVGWISFGIILRRQSQLIDKRPGRIQQLKALRLRQGVIIQSIGGSIDPDAQDATHPGP